MASAPSPPSGPTGIQFTITWPETTADLVIQRDTSGAFSSPTEIARYTSPRGSHIDYLAVDGVTYYYRARHEEAGQTDSAWSSSINDTPHTLAPL